MCIRDSTNTTRASRKGVQPICFLWIAAQCNCTSSQNFSSLGNETSARCSGSMRDLGALLLFRVFVLWNVHCLSLIHIYVLQTDKLNTLQVLLVSFDKLYPFHQDGFSTLYYNNNFFLISYVHIYTLINKLEFFLICLITLNRLIFCLLYTSRCV